jgi:uncharacterized RDD family membrane protein YckC
MKCPKCQYFSFDSGDRCRNCGYDFSLTLDLPPVDLPIQDGSEPIGPLSDFSLNETPNLPLFTGGSASADRGDPDAPLVTPGATPRAPLAVRRTAPVAPRPAAQRPKPRREPGRIDRDPEPRLALDTADLGPVPETVAAVRTETAIADDRPAVAPAGARLAGALIDVALLGAIDLIVVYFTLKICDLTFAEVFTLPLAPLLSFLFLLNGGYLSAFVAATGQTIGKMAAGTRVIPADPAAPASERVTFGQAVVRAAGYLVSALPAGLGFLPAFFGAERRALHDRLADTRVVKA